MITVALTGGIGAGKSTVSAGLVARGAVLVDADAIVHDLQRPGGEVLVELADRFGPDIVAGDGSLDRAALAAIVFGDAEALRDLNRIVHPRVGAEITRRLDDLADSDAIVVLDIPLLTEGIVAGRRPPYPVSGVLVVDVPVETQVQRLVDLRGMSEADARARIAHQAGRDERLGIADRVIDNTGDLDELDARLDAVVDWARTLEPVTMPEPEPPNQEERADGVGE